MSDLFQLVYEAKRFKTAADASSSRPENSSVIDDNKSVFEWAVFMNNSNRIDSAL